MYKYTLTNRDGKQYSIQSEKELTNEQLTEISLPLNEARASDYFKGAASAVAEFGYNTLEFAHEVGNFLGGEASKLLYGEDVSKDVENPWTEFKETSREFYEGDVPESVKQKLSYKVIAKGLPQLGVMAASGPIAPFTLAAQGFASGRDDYLNTMGIDPSTATDEQLEQARAVGAINAIPTMFLERIGLGKIAKNLTQKMRKGVAAPAAKRVLSSAATEGSTEALEQVSQNVIARDIAQYDPERERSEGIGEAAVVGALVGGTPGTVRYSPKLVSESVAGVQKVGDLVVDKADLIAQSNAAKKIVDATAKGLTYTGDVASDIGQRAVGALSSKGINIEPLIEGGKFVAEKSKMGAENILEASKKPLDIISKGADAYRNSQAAKMIDDFIRPLNDRVRAYNERIGQTLVSFEHEHMKRYHDFYKMAQAPLEILSTIKKQSKNEYDALHKAILRKDFDTAKEIFLRYGTDVEWQAIGSTLRTIYEESAQRGSGIGHIEEYFPRFIKDFRGLGKRLGHDVPDSQWEKVVKNAEDKKGEPLTSEELSAIFEDLIRSKEFKGVEVGKPSFLKGRKIEEVTDDTAEFYAEPIEAMALYLNQMADNITRLDYLGAMYDVVQAGEEDAIYTPQEISEGKGKPAKKTRRLGEFGKAIQEEIDAGRLDDTQLDEIYRLLGARFQRKSPMHGFTRGAKTLTHLLFLGSPTTAITQLGDYAYSFYRNGINQTLRALGKPEWTLEDVYQIGNDIGFEFTEKAQVPKKLQKMLDKVLTLTGMRAMDAKAKATFLTGTSNKWKKILNGRDSKAKFSLIEKIQKQQGFQQASETIAALKSGKKTDGVAEMLLYELGDIAPITQSDMPLMYNSSPNVRMLYALKSYTLKQFNLARKDIFSKLVSGDRAEVKEGFKNLLYLSSSLALANIPADIIKSFITGEDIELDDLHIDALWRLFGLNSYTQVMIQRDGVGSAIENLTYKLPLVQFIDDLGRDVLHFAPPLISKDSRTTKYIPVIGKLLHKWQQD
jgi:hypothetical protein